MVAVEAQAADPELVAAVCGGDVQRLVTLAAASPTVLSTRATSLFLALGMAGQVVLDRSTATACLVRRGTACHVRLGPDFLLERVLTADDLAYLLLHEVAHLVLGHVSVPATGVPRGTRDRARDEGADSAAFVAKVENMAADMLVARFLHQRLDETPGLDGRVHGPGTSVCSALMATPETVLGRRWLFGDPLAPRDVAAAFFDRYRHHEPPGLSRIIEPLAGLYTRVWGRARGVPLDELTRELAGWLAPFAASLTPPPLALKVARGGERWIPPWARPVPGVARALPPGWSRGLRDARQGEVSSPGHGGGAGGDLDDVVIEAAAAAERVAALTAWLRNALRGSPVMPQRWEPAARGPLRSPVPAAFGRTEALHLAAGLLPPMYPLPLAPACDELPVRAYVDVSGSTQDLWSLLLRALSGVLSHRRVLAFQFSNAVAPLGRDSRSVRTTGGTDFDCVVEHARGHREVFVITDGYANLHPRLRQRARGTRVHLLLTGAVQGEVEAHVQRQFGELLVKPPGCVWVPEKLLET